MPDAHKQYMLHWLIGYLEQASKGRQGLTADQCARVSIAAQSSKSLEDFRAAVGASV